MNPFHHCREMIIENADRFTNFDELKQYAIEMIKQFEIDGICDSDEEDYQDVETWVNSKDFCRWLGKDHESIPSWLHKIIVFELLKK